MSNGLMYTAVFEEVAATAVQDLFEINAPSSAVVVLHRCVITQSSDAGDAASEQLAILFHRGSTSGSGGSTPTARPLNVSASAFAGTIEVNNTTQSTEGNQVHAEAFNVMAGFDYHPTPEARIVIPPSGRLIIELQTAPADSLTLNGTIVFEVIG